MGTRMDIGEKARHGSDPANSVNTPQYGAKAVEVRAQDRTWDTQRLELGLTRRDRPPQTAFKMSLWAFRECRNATCISLNENRENAIFSFALNPEP